MFFFIWLKGLGNKLLVFFNVLEEIFLKIIYKNLIMFIFELFFGCVSCIYFRFLDIVFFIDNRVI